MSGIYTVATAFGVVDATFPDDAGVHLEGPPDAVDAVLRAIRDSIDERGMTTTPEALDPDRFVGFCQGEAKGIFIMPPADIELLPDSPEPEDNDMDTTAALDKVGVPPTKYEAMDQVKKFAKRHDLTATDGPDGVTLKSAARDWKQDFDGWIEALEFITDAQREHDKTGRKMVFDGVSLPPEQSERCRQAYEDYYHKIAADTDFSLWAYVWSKAIAGPVSGGATINIHDGVEELPGMREAIAAATNPLERIALVRAMKAAQAAWAAEEADTGLTADEYAAVARTILQQLGGNKFKVMTGAKNFTAMTRNAGNAPSGGLAFTIPSGLSQVNGKSTSINAIKVRLNASDTYDVEFASSRGKSYTVKATATDIYADVLQEVFTRYTGLDTSLGRGGPNPYATKRIGIQEASDAMDSLRWSINDLQGHSDMELARAGSTDGIEAKVEAVRRMEAGWPEDFASPRSTIEQAEAIIDRARALRADGGIVEISQGDVKSFYFQGGTMTDEQKAAILAKPSRVIRSGQFDVPRFNKAKVEAMVAEFEAANAKPAILERIDGDDGMYVNIVASTRAEGGFNVVLRDGDAEETAGAYVNMPTIEAARAKARELLGIKDAPPPTAVPEGALAYDPATNRYNGQELKRGAILKDASGNRYRLDRANGFMLSVDRIDEAGQASGGIRSFSVDPFDKNRYLQVWLSEEAPVGKKTITLPAGTYAPGSKFEADGRRWSATKVAHTGLELTASVVDGGFWREQVFAIEQAAPGAFRYALVNRPADLGAIPKVPYTVEPRPAAGQPHHDMARHGILTTERELTAEEVKAFELAPLVDGADLGVLAAKVAEGMAEYAAGHLEMAAEEPNYLRQQIMQTVERASSGIRYSIGDPALLVQMVRDKLAAMVPANPRPDNQLALDTKFLTEVADGKHPAMLEPELADDIEAAITRHPDDAALQALGERAIIAYSNGLMSATG